VAWGVNYYRKKAVQLLKHERELLLAIQKGWDAARVEAAAEEVRAAQIRVLKSREAQLVASEKAAVERAAIEKEIVAWKAVPLEAIVAEYRRKAGKQELPIFEGDAPPAPVARSRAGG
jgi:3-dehydroquinate synthase class II